MYAEIFSNLFSTNFQISHSCWRTFSFHKFNFHLTSTWKSIEYSSTSYARLSVRILLMTSCVLTLDTCLIHSLTVVGFWIAECSLCDFFIFANSHCYSTLSGSYFITTYSIESDSEKERYRVLVHEWDIFCSQESRRKFDSMSVEILGEEEEQEAEKVEDMFPCLQRQPDYSNM